MRNCIGFCRSANLDLASLMGPIAKPKSRTAPVALCTSSLPFRTQRLAIAAKCIRQKAVNFRSDLLDTRALQIQDHLVKLVDILFGQKEITASLHPCLAGELYSVQALAICPLAQGSPVMDFICPMESKPQRGCSQ